MSTMLAPKCRPAEIERAWVAAIVAELTSYFTIDSDGLTLLEYEARDIAGRIRLRVREASAQGTARTLP